MSSNQIKAATPQQYRNTFTHGDGIDILTELEAKFLAPDPFVPGAADKTSFNCGAAHVVRYILQRLTTEEEPKA